MVKFPLDGQISSRVLSLQIINSLQRQKDTGMPHCPAAQMSLWRPARRYPPSTIRISLAALSILLLVAPATCTRNTSSARVLLRGQQRERLRPHGARWNIAHDDSEGGGGNMFDGVTLRDAADMMGARISDVYSEPFSDMDKLGASEGGALGKGRSLPEAYDVRDAWPMCSAVSRVMAQGGCNIPTSPSCNRRLHQQSRPGGSPGAKR